MLSGNGPFLFIDDDGDALAYASSRLLAAIDYERRCGVELSVSVLTLRQRCEAVRAVLLNRTRSDTNVVTRAAAAGLSSTLINVKQAAKILDRDERSVRRAAARGDLGAFKEGGVYLLDATAVANRATIRKAGEL